MRRNNKTSFIMNIRTRIDQYKSKNCWLYTDFRHQKTVWLPSPLAASLTQAARQASTVGILVGVGVVMPETRGGW